MSYEINLKLGNMRKAEEFVIYPHKNGDAYFSLQSDHRFLILKCEPNEENGTQHYRGILSKYCANYPSAVHCDLRRGGIPVKVTPDIVAQILQKYPRSGQPVCPGVLSVLFA